MRYSLIFSILFLSFQSCYDKDNFLGADVANVDTGPGCEGVDYPSWEFSPYVLPYSVGQSYRIGLSHCSGGLHSEGEPDQFAIDFNMNIGTLVTAVRVGTIVFVEESGLDNENVNNIVVLRDEEGFYFQYMHLTENGALVEVGDVVNVGDPIGYTGSSGLARYPHLHLVTTRGGWSYPYTSYPITFRNTSPNPLSLVEGDIYEALPY